MRLQLLQNLCQIQPGKWILSWPGFCSLFTPLASLRLWPWSDSGTLVNVIYFLGNDITWLKCITYHIWGPWYSSSQFYSWFKEGFGCQLLLLIIRDAFLNNRWYVFRNTGDSEWLSSGIKCCLSVKFLACNMAPALLSGVSQGSVRSIFYLGLSLFPILPSPSIF